MCGRLRLQGSSWVSVTSVALLAIVQLSVLLLHVVVERARLQPSRVGAVGSWVICHRSATMSRCGARAVWWIRTISMPVRRGVGTRPTYVSPSPGRSRDGVVSNVDQLVRAVDLGHDSCVVVWVVVVDHHFINRCLLLHGSQPPPRTHSNIS